MEAGAILSEDREYRYVLWRIWDTSKPSVMFIGLNPSTADESIDDPTIRRCINYARSWGYGAIYMTNLFALRSSKPSELYNSKNPIGDENDKFLLNFQNKCDLVVACWGNHGSFMNRSSDIKELFNQIKCFGTNQTGQPKHPLYLKKDVQLIPYNF